MSGKSHYILLGITDDAKPSDITRAYRLLALKYHPDKTSDPQAAERFLRIKEAYEVLSDPAKRKRYDRGEEDVNAPEWIRPEFDLQELSTLARTYPGSSEELEDLRKFLLSAKGDVKNVFEWIPFTEPSDAECRRLCEQIETLMEGDVDLEASVKATYEKTRPMLLKSIPSLRRKAAAERRRHEESYGEESFEDLARKIQANQRSRAQKARKHFDALADQPSIAWKGGKKVKKILKHV